MHRGSIHGLNTWHELTSRLEDGTSLSVVSSGGHTERDTSAGIVIDSYAGNEMTGNHGRDRQDLRPPAQ